ncbi:MAG TPA: glycosyltransferase family 9 protein [Desulfomonilaceae bacterium]|nr:glycosyltransferase family 9 protein [Desulfomonilaceae bacterium]
MKCKSLKRPHDWADLTGKRILILKPSSLGDVVHTLPLVHALKRENPSCFIGWVIQRNFVGIVEADAAVDEIIPIFIPSTSDPGARRGVVLRAAAATAGTLLELKRQFAESAYDFVLDLHASFRSGLLGLTNPGGTRIGFADAKELNTRFQHQLIPPDPARPHAVDKNLLFAEYFGYAPKPEDFRIVSSARAKMQVDEFLDQVGGKDSRKIVYANPVARWDTKFWTVPAWAELSDMLTEDDMTVIFAGGMEDLAYIAEVVEKTKYPPVIAAGRLTLAAAIALLERADAYVGVDSGPMHIAAFTGTPVVALFGPTDPAKVGPYGKGHIVITHENLDCLSCRKRSCGNRKCLEEITAVEVHQAVRKILNVS